MAGFRDFPTRFRPASAPGPTAIGVPAERSAELAPLLALLEAAESEARTIRETAAEEAPTARRLCEQRPSTPRPVPPPASSATRRPAPVGECARCAATGSPG